MNIRLTVRLFQALGLITLSVLSYAVSAAEQPSPPLERGEYLMRMGDCIACHTAPGGTPLAGGLPFKTPVGVIYSTNITPDRQYGIGTYRFDQFDRAMRRGIAADGHLLYPAMPYPSFAKVTPEDMKALYTALMNRVEPKAQPNRASDIPWPFSMRWPLFLWNLLFLDDRPFQADSTHTASWNRGAYITEGLGHCGSCHTPRGFALQEKATHDRGDSGGSFLAGSTIEGWHAKNIRGISDPGHLAEFLKTGQDETSAAFGTMTEVIHFSTQYLNTADLLATGEYLQSLSVPAGEPQVNKPTHIIPDALYQTAGGLGYDQFCATCHRRDGTGVPHLFPALAGNRAVISPDPTSLIHVVLTGWQTAETDKTPRALGMPKYHSLSDDELADILNFIRNHWGNRAPAVSVEAIRKVREFIPLHNDPAPVFVVPRYARMLRNPNSADLIYGMRLVTESKALLPDYVGDVLNCTSCHLDGGTTEKASPFVGLAGIFPSYAPRAGRVISTEDRINGCMRRSMNGTILPLDSRPMKAMVAYFEWMKGSTKPGDKIPGRGLGHFDKSLQPNPGHGEKVYQDQCALCHGKKGEGRQLADGSVVFPPLWGDQSFNIGAGMARTYTAAAFVKSDMPIAHGEQFPMAQGGLSDQDALDVAEYFSHQPRPDFPDKIKDWPKGNKPVDARY